MTRHWGLGLPSRRPRASTNSCARGALHGATFLQPVAQLFPGRRWPWSALHGSDVRVGGLFAWSSGPYTNPYELASGGRYLGTEVDCAVSYGRALDKWLPVFQRLYPSVEVQGGHLFAGPALTGIDRRVITHLMGIVRVRW